MRKSILKRFKLPSDNQEAIIIARIKNKNITTTELYNIYAGIAEYVTSLSRKMDAHYKKCGLDIVFGYEDKLQEARYGLWIGVSRIDIEKSINIKSYLTLYAKGYLLASIQTKAYMFKYTSRSARKAVWDNELEALNDLIYLDAVDYTEADIDLNIPEYLIDYSPIESFPNLINPKDVNDIFSQYINKKPVFKSIVEDRLLSEDPVTYSSIAEKHKITKQRVRQLENQIIRKVADHLKDNYDEKIPEIRNYILPTERAKKEKVCL